MAHCYHEFACQGRRFMGCLKGALGLGLIMVHVCYEFALQGGRIRVVQKGV
jgi:hypothetical protein